MKTVFLVSGIIAVQAVIWIIILRYMHKESASLIGKMKDELAGENVLLGPVAGMYRGATSSFDSVKGNAVIALTDKELIIHKLLGGTIKIPLSDIVSVEKNKWFKGSYRDGQDHVIVQTTGNAKIGFMAPNPSEWISALESRVLS